MFSTLRTRFGIPGGTSAEPSDKATRLRLTLLAASAAAFLLVPAAQAFAAGTVTVNIEGAGAGEVSSVGGFEGLFEGSPPIECTYASPGSAGGICEDETTEAFGVLEGIALHAVAAPGFEFAGWVAEKNGEPTFCGNTAEKCAAQGPNGTITSFEVTATFILARPKFPLSLSTSGTGSGSFECISDGFTYEPCAAEYVEGTSVTVIPGATPGSEFVEWSGACTGSGSCEVTMSEAKSVDARFDLETVGSEFSLTVTKSGTGSGTATSTPVGINCGGACSAEFPESTLVTLNQSATAGSEFVEWSGACTGSGSCEVTMSEAKSVGAKFDLAPPANEFPLTVIITGHGSVSSSPAGLNCSSPAEECTAELPEGSVTLTATPASGYTFAGWLGCKHTGAGTCSVNLSGATEVTAVFLANGAQGPTGPQGDPGGTGPQGNPGATGPQGNPGATGSQGSTGPAGSQGSTGPAGPQGAAGPKGTDGANGKDGAQGPQGPAGKVTCKVKQKGAKVKVTCAVKQPASARAARLHWRLMRGGHAQSHGTARGGHLRLDLGHLRPGRYLIHVDGQKGGTPIVVG